MFFGPPCMKRDDILVSFSTCNETDRVPTNLSVYLCLKYIATASLQLQFNLVKNKISQYTFLLV